MAELKKEYTDKKNIKHKVEHVTPPADKTKREQVIEELHNALIKPKKRIGA